MLLYNNIIIKEIQLFTESPKLRYMEFCPKTLTLRFRCPNLDLPMLYPLCYIFFYEYS